MRGMEDSLGNPELLGVHIERGFVSPGELEAVQAETETLDWIDAHETYENARGLTIVQNHFTYALDLAGGDLEPMEAIPRAVALMERTQRFVQAMGGALPGLAEWKPNELSFHLYDDAKVGLSHHKDNTRFVGVVAIASIDGICDLSILKDGETTELTVRPGDLALLRAPKMTADKGDLRPEHAVLNLQTDTRTSMMMRQNEIPEQPIPGFVFNNHSDGRRAP